MTSSQLGKHQLTGRQTLIRLEDPALVVSTRGRQVAVLRLHFPASLLINERKGNETIKSSLIQEGRREQGMIKKHEGRRKLRGFLLG